MRKRIGLFGATDEALALIPLLAANPEAEIADIVDPDPDGVLARTEALDPALASAIQARLTDDVSVLTGDPTLHAIVDASGPPGFAARHPEVVERGVQVVTPLAARLLWAYGSDDRKTELLTALREVVASVNLTIDADELFRRMLEIALGVTGAEAGSLMLLSPDGRELGVRVAVGIEPELWPKIRLPLGDGIAGRVAAEARPLRLRGRADRQTFRIVRERLDVESALCVPLVFEGRVLGVLNLHHTTRPDAFSADDLAFAEQLARLDAQIIARAQERESLRDQAARYEAVREVRTILGSKRPLGERLGEFCRFAAGRLGGGIASVYLWDPESEDLRLSATSLDNGGGLGGGEYRILPGQGIDGEVARTREPALLRGADGGLAYASLPLVAGDALAGVLALQAGSDAPRGRAAEEILLELAAAAAEEIVQSEREARIAARARKVAAINEAGIRMVSADDPAEVMRIATSSAAMVLEADHAVLRVHDEETGRYVIRSYFGSADGRLQERLFRLDKQISVDTLKRRAPVLVRDVKRERWLRELDSEVQSLIAAPLLREGRAIGTLAIYDKVASDRFYPSHFTGDDLQLFTKFVAYAERAVSSALLHALARRYRNFDEGTGLPNAGYLGKRIREEIARAGARPGALAVALCRIENLDEVERAADASHARRVVERAAEALRLHLRDFDVVGRTAEDQFTVLMPEPGRTPGERVFGLARGVAEEINKDESLNDPVRVTLGFGYAVHPEDGADAEALLEVAREPRIRMV